MDSFDSFEKVKDGIYKCKTCKKEVLSGIFNISGHWVECTGKDFYKNLIDVANSMKQKTKKNDKYRTINR